MRRGLALCVLLAACSSDKSSSPKPAEDTMTEGGAQPVTIYAASSMKELVTELGDAWTRKTGQEARLQFEASSTLARQIAEGAPADVFITASPEWLDKLKLIDRFDWLSNRLVVVVRKDVAAFDLKSAESMALANEQVPAGKYARAALTHLGIKPPERTIYGSNVRDVLSKVSQGGAQAGIVYATDAAVNPEVRVAMTFPRGEPSEDPLLGRGHHRERQGLRRHTQGTGLDRGGREARVRRAQMNSVEISLTVGVASTAISLPPAIATALYLERTRSRARHAVQTLIMLPLVLPPVVVGYLLLKVFSPIGPLGVALAGLGVPVAFHWLGAVTAAAVVGFPLFVLMIALALKAVDPRFERVSRSLGVSPWRTFWRVTLPLTWPGILAGAAVAFARGLGEFGATIILAGRIPGETQTIPLHIYAELDAPGGERRIVGLVLTACAICLVCVAVSRILDSWYRHRLELDR